MKTYVEDITEEEHEQAGVVLLSLIQGMTMYRAEVRDSDITIFTEDGNELEDQDKYNELLIQIEKYGKGEK